MVQTLKMCDEKMAQLFILYLLFFNNGNLLFLVFFNMFLFKVYFGLDYRFKLSIQFVNKFTRENNIEKILKNEFKMRLEDGNMVSKNSLACQWLRVLLSLAIILTETHLDFE